MHRGVFLLCGCHSLSGDWEREWWHGGGQTSLLGASLNYGGKDYWWEQDCGLRQPSEEPFVLQPDRFLLQLPLQAAGIALPHSGCCMALEGFTELGVTEEGAEFGLGWQVYANVLYLL